MEKSIRGIFKTLVLGVLLFNGVHAATSGLTPEEKLAKHTLIKNAFRCNIAAETIANSYLYIGEAIGARQAKRELKSSMEIFDKNYKSLSESINDPKMKNLLEFVKMSYDELTDLLKEPYTIDNAQIVLDLVGTISEGSRHVAEVYKKAIGHKDPVSMSGLRPMIESISKYYIAYQAGIKDENTINLMKSTVDNCDKLITVRLKYPQNTVAMNQKINKVSQLWKIVNKFYLDIDDGGLPFIVFKTTTKLKKELKAYDVLYSKLKREQLKAGK